MQPADNQGPEKLERFRSYLELMANVQLHRQLQAKFDPSDIVQQTLVQAVQAFGDFRGQTEAEMAGWLRQILANQMANAVREFSRAKRNVAREASIFVQVEDASRQLVHLLPGEETSPTGRAMKNEEALSLAAAIAELPEGQREAITLHHLSGWTLEQIGKRLDRSPAAVAGLIKRGLQALRKSLGAAG